MFRSCKQVFKPLKQVDGQAPQVRHRKHAAQSTLIAMQQHSVPATPPTPRDSVRGCWHAWPAREREAVRSTQLQCWPSCANFSYIGVQALQGSHEARVV